jgi:hypothetical protein
LVLPAALREYAGSVTTASQAREVAQERLAGVMPRRWAHVQGVARVAVQVAASLAVSGDGLVAAAWLHDIGYAPGVKDTGLHSLDGARHLRRIGVDEAIICLVAYHSCAFLEAAERGFDADLLTEFRPGDPVLADALCFCDMTTSPGGEPVDARDRLAEIQVRYGRGAVVTRFIERAAPDILAAVARTQKRLRAVDSHAM